ncbi:MAG: hypothetical protein NTY82_06155 [Actinobacteria bacterium]|nr:hypothetical protein [Actinomycetota bacterium]
MREPVFKGKRSQLMDLNDEVQELAMTDVALLPNSVHQIHDGRCRVLAAVDELVMAWHGQAGIDVPGGSVRREADGLQLSTHS